MFDWVGGGTEPELHERRDGYLEVGAGPELYLAPARRWPRAEGRAMAYAVGRVLDVGCGAGRVALHLQQLGVEVTGLDVSALAVRAARRRGVRDVQLGTVQSFAAQLADFDTLVLLGNNAGIFGTPDGLRKGLRRWARLMRPGARLLAGSTSPYGGTAPLLDAEWRQNNRRQGKMAGQLRLRVRYGKLASPWFNWLFLSPGELATLVDGTGWRWLRTLQAGDDEPFVAVLEREQTPG